MSVKIFVSIKKNVTIFMIKLIDNLRALEMVV